MWISTLKLPSAVTIFAQLHPLLAFCFEAIEVISCVFGDVRAFLPAIWNFYVFATSMIWRRLLSPGILSLFDFIYRGDENSSWQVED